MVMERLHDIVTHDFWILLGAETPPASALLGVLFVLLLVSAIWHFEPRRETVLAAGIVTVSVGFWVLCNETYRGGVRYVMITLPILYAFAARELIRLSHRRRLLTGVVSVLVATGITVALFLPRYADAREVAAAHRETFEGWGGFDPRPALKAVAEGRYTVCYADVWVAHKLEWLSETNVRFIPYRSVNRRMVESLRLAASTGPKCFVKSDGTVHHLTPQQEERLRLEVLWHAYGWQRPTPVPWR